MVVAIRALVEELPASSVASFATVLDVRMLRKSDFGTVWAIARQLHGCPLPLGGAGHAQRLLHGVLFRISVKVLIPFFDGVSYRGGK